MSETSTTITERQQAHYTKICRLCNGTGQDLFNKTKPCPNCQHDQVLVDFWQDKHALAINHN